MVRCHKSVDILQPCYNCGRSNCQISSTPPLRLQTPKSKDGLFIPFRLSCHSKLITQFKALCKKLINAPLSFWDVFSNHEFAIYSHVINRVKLRRLVFKLKFPKGIRRTFMLYGYKSLGELTPPEFLTSMRQRLSVCSWLYTGSNASDTGSDETIK